LGAAARLSVGLGLVPAETVRRVERVLAAQGLPVRLARPLPWADLLAAMQRDKKVRAGGLRFVVLAAVGGAATRGDVPLPLAEEAFRAVGAG
jgi:3-dehydroquinate synthetase